MTPSQAITAWWDIDRGVWGDFNGFLSWASTEAEDFWRVGGVFAKIEAALVVEEDKNNEGQ